MFSFNKKPLPNESSGSTKNSCFPVMKVSLVTSGIIIDYLLLDSDIVIGTDIIIADPRFDNFIDFKLSPISPCIDAGHPGDQYLDPDSSRNDIGAYGGPRSRL